MSQGEFASACHINVRTLQGWEIGNSRPGGASKVLMWLICNAPEAVLKLLKEAN
jgi:DNA-binding transcriptional regulator YiaG